MSGELYNVAKRSKKKLKVQFVGKVEDLYMELLTLIDYGTYWDEAEGVNGGASIYTHQITELVDRFFSTK